VVVLDRHGVITRVNEAWRRFARENGAAELAEHSVGLSYLAVCPQAVDAPYGESTRDVVEGIRAVLMGTQPHFSLEYPRHSPTEYRTFRLDVVPVAGGGAVIAQTQLMAFRRPETRTQALTGAAPSTLTALGDEITQASARQTAAQPSLASRTQVLRETVSD